jgi:hypothetical protein
MSDLVILHWNDAYEIDAEAKTEPVGGSARFLAKCEEIKASSTAPVMVTCGGDIFNPSMLSVVHKGKHMIPVLKALSTLFLSLF